MFVVSKTLNFDPYKICAIFHTMKKVISHKISAAE